MPATPWTSPSPGIGLGAPGQVTLVDGSTFLVAGPSGDLAGSGPQGFFMFDTRLLSTWQLLIDGRPVEPIMSHAEGPFSATLIGRVPHPERADSDLAVVRRRHLGHGMREDIELRYAGTSPRPCVVALEVAADFASVFAVKAGSPPDGAAGWSSVEDDRLVLRPRRPAPADAVSVVSSRRPTDWGPGAMRWDLVLEPGQTVSWCLEVAVRVGGVDLAPSHRCGEPVESAVPVGRLSRWRAAAPTVTTDHPTLAATVARSIEDLGSLRIFDPDHVDRVVVAAGAPWFMTLFGRDALLTAWMALLVDPDLARGVLASLADAQGLVVDPLTEEQPGRILHEVRFDTESSRLLGGRNIYYGTIDATPLFVMLAAELVRWTGEPDDVRPLLPSIDRAMDWLTDLGDRDGDDFVEYLRATPSGLANQGWKDSWDGIRHRDGSVADAPIALAEVQAYAIAAHRGRADLADLFDDPAVAMVHRAMAERLVERFEEAFWCGDEAWYAVGLDGAKQPIASLASNLGHVLWAGAASPDRGRRTAALLAGDGLFSGWGVRTLASTMPGYNPLSYHCGSVWPHDTAIACAGLAAYGSDEALHVVAGGLLDAAAALGGRLPELFAGFERDDVATPVPYPTSCSPQAWAAGASLLVVRALLGLAPDLANGVVRLRPRLLPGMERLVVRDVPLGGGRVTIAVESGEVAVDGLPEGVALSVS